MNTFTDAQLIVSRDVADLLDRDRAAATRSVRRPTSATRIDSCVEHGFIVETATRSAQALEAFFRDVRESTEPAAGHGPDDAAVQLRLRLLHPGRPRRLQQARREDVAGDGGARRPSGSSSGSTRWRPTSFVLTFFGGEPLLNLPVLYYLAERLLEQLPGARRARC